MSAIVQLENLLAPLLLKDLVNTCIDYVDGGSLIDLSPSHETIQAVIKRNCEDLKSTFQYAQKTIHSHRVHHLGSTHLNTEEVIKMYTLGQNEIGNYFQQILMPSLTKYQFMYVYEASIHLRNGDITAALIAAQSKEQEANCWTLEGTSSNTLGYAANKGDFETCDRLIRLNPWGNILKNVMQYAFNNAAENGNIPSGCYLVSKRPDLNIGLALLAAAGKGQLTFVQFLLDINQNNYNYRNAINYIDVNHACNSAKGKASATWGIRQLLLNLGLIPEEARRKALEFYEEGYEFDAREEALSANDINHSPYSS